MPKSNYQSLKDYIKKFLINLEDLEFLKQAIVDSSSASVIDDRQIKSISTDVEGSEKILTKHLKTLKNIEPLGTVNYDPPDNDGSWYFEERISKVLKERNILEFNRFYLNAMHVKISMDLMKNNNSIYSDNEYMSTIFNTIFNNDEFGKTPLITLTTNDKGDVTGIEVSQELETLLNNALTTNHPPTDDHPQTDTTDIFFTLSATSFILGAILSAALILTLCAIGFMMAPVTLIPTILVGTALSLELGVCFFGYMITQLTHADPVLKDPVPEGPSCI